MANVKESEATHMSSLVRPLKATVASAKRALSKVVANAQQLKQKVAREEAPGTDDIIRPASHGDGDDEASTTSSSATVSRIDPARVQELLTRTWFGLLSSLPLDTLPSSTGREQPRRASTRTDWADSWAAWRERPEDCLLELESYTLSGARNSGILFRSCFLLEVANGCFLAPEVRLHPSMMKLNWAAALHTALVNDLFFDAADESSNWYPDREHNLVRMLMRHEKMSVAQAVRRAVEVANSYADALPVLEADLPRELGRQPNVRRYVRALKESVSGNVEFHLKNVAGRLESSVRSSL